MPIYEYTCAKCKHTMEALQKMSDVPLRKCPACGKAALEKMISAASFRLKGGGWYETDFKTGDKKQLADSDSANASGNTDAAKTAKKDTADKSDKPAAPHKNEAVKSTAQADSSSNSKPGKASKAAAKKKSSKQ